MTDVSESYLESLRDRADHAEAALAGEQREHDTTRRQRDTLQTQCEDMQSEMETETKLNNAALKPSVGVDNQAVVDIVVEKDDKISILMQRVSHADERLETANAMATTYADANAALKRELATTTQRLENVLNVTDEMVSTDMRDEMACMAEEVQALKEERVDLDRRTIELQSMVDTRDTHMQQVDAACKAAEAKVIEQRKEIEALKSGEDLWICPDADTCIATPIECKHTTPHSHYGDGCDIICVAAKNKCIKVNTCKECATLREEIAALTMNADRCAICESTQLEEITNRDAVIVQQESRAEDREEIIKALAKEIKLLRQGENVATGSGGGQSRCGDEHALTIGKFKIAFSGKRECMVKQGVHTRLLRNGDIVTVNPVITILDV